MFVALITDLVESDSQSVPVRFFSLFSTHNVGLGAHANSAVTKAFFDERHLDAQRRTRLNPLWIEEECPARADIYRAQSQRLRTGLAGDVAHGK